MGLLKKAAGVLGLSGSAKAGREASGQLFQIGDELRNFTPLRVRSLAGTGTYGKDGLSFDLDPRLAAGAGSGLDFFGNTMSKLAAFNEGDASARTLNLLRQRRASMFDTQLSRLESRLLQQGRLGLGTGGRAANPEMEGFFGAEAMADLESQIIANEEARREREGLLQAATGGLGLAWESAMPSRLMQGLFSAEGLRSARDIAAANVKAGSPALAMQGVNRDLDARAGFFGNLIGAGSKVLAGGMG